jgi:hypothetical protein
MWNALHFHHFSFLEELSEIWSKKYIGLHVKCPLFSSDFNEACSSLTNFRKILKCRISWKSLQWDPSCYMRTDRRMEMMKVIATFPNYANGSINDFNYVNFPLHIELRLSRMKKKKIKTNPSTYLCCVFWVFEKLCIQYYTRREGGNIATYWVDSWPSVLSYYPLLPKRKT